MRNGQFTRKFEFYDVLINDAALLMGREVKKTTAIAVTSEKLMNN